MGLSLKCQNSEAKPQRIDFATQEHHARKLALKKHDLKLDNLTQERMNRDLQRLSKMDYQESDRPRQLHPKRERYLVGHKTESSCPYDICNGQIIKEKATNFNLSVQHQKAKAFHRLQLLDLNTNNHYDILTGRARPSSIEPVFNSTAGRPTR